MDILQNSLAAVGNNPDAIFKIVGSILIGILLFFIITVVVPLCLIYKKAGRGWWEAIIPFYNLYVLAVITGQPWWVLLGFLVPGVNCLVSIYLNYHLSKRFGFGIPFTIGLVLLPFIFLPILAFGSSMYIKPEEKS
ncbi:DUF5684 domain-containing protein [Candidatus Gracilibacteria bacterium]|nr:DUF5684 domain-containing protein [Candidatus Gracilibacteria bacterium]MCF7898454.1 DUF5684 domain-containing protein [Candidatus Paceibacterota bacterium]